MLFFFLPHTGRVWQLALVHVRPRKHRRSQEGKPGQWRPSAGSPAPAQPRGPFSVVHLVVVVRFGADDGGAHAVVQTPPDAKALGLRRPFGRRVQPERHGRIAGRRVEDVGAGPGGAPEVLRQHGQPSPSGLCQHASGKQVKPMQSRPVIVPQQLI